MDPFFSFRGFFGRALAWSPLLLSAGLVSFALRIGRDSPFVAAGLVALSMAAFIPTLLVRRRFRRLLASGDPELIAPAWQRVIRNDVAADAEAPRALMSAITYAACGWVEQAREHLAKTTRSAGLDPTGEHRMFVETMLEAFDGDRELAVSMAARIGAMPVPEVGVSLQRKVLALRTSLGALARAFAHVSLPGDLEVLESAAGASPLISWAMRYAAAIALLDRNDPLRALAMLEGAPDWPQQSAFRAFHHELAVNIADALARLQRNQEL